MVDYTSYRCNACGRKWTDHDPDVSTDSAQGIVCPECNSSEIKSSTVSNENFDFNDFFA